MRINKLKAVEAVKTRRILGMIASSPTPLMIHELEQALRVSNDPSSNATVSSKLNVSRMCGSIVEVLDEYVQFVHFAVKE